MSEIEKIKRYISQTKMSAQVETRYGMDITEAFNLANQAYENNGLPIEIISLAFSYGQAKGYRAAKKEARSR